jgi:hypothetical protein
MDGDWAEGNGKEDARRKANWVAETSYRRLRATRASSRCRRMTDLRALGDGEETIRARG